MKTVTSDHMGMCMVVADQEQAQIWVQGVLQESAGSALVLVPLGQTLEVKVACRGYEETLEKFTATKPLSFCYLRLQRKRHLKVVESATRTKKIILESTTSVAHL